LTYKAKTIIPEFWQGIVNSYAQVFLSASSVLGVILIVVTFFDFYAGLSGLLAVLCSNLLAWMMGFNRFRIKSGYYGFNSLLVGLGIGIYYQPGVEFFFLLLFAALFTLFLTIAMEGILGKYGLPYLSISFLLGIWLVTLASRQFASLELSERGIFSLNEMYRIGGLNLVDVFQWFHFLPIHESILIYFRSLGAIVFQYHLVPGILIALGLLFYSRIAFFLSLSGFYTAYLFYWFIGANITELSYGYIGFNFILTSIAIGGFFLIPNLSSFLWMILLVPITSVLMTSLNSLFSLMQLSIFSLPFNIIVLVFLYILKFRERFFFTPELVVYQQFSPEKNLYSQINYKGRFNTAFSIPFSLPFMGEWRVTQGQNGELTHRNEWRHAWDFEIFDSQGKRYAGKGDVPGDYFCFGKPVMAPADGVVEEIADGVEDNPIGMVNPDDNWGNTLIIRHAPTLFSKLCHLKKESFQVKKGDIVKQGDRLALCGNSGRSPVPHVHFQIQATPYIGSQTLDYPLNYYIARNQSGFQFKILAKPESGDLVSNIQLNETLRHAFLFIPGQKLRLIEKDRDHQVIRELTWEVLSDFYGNPYIYCPLNKSAAYFRNDGNVHYFTHFTGNQNGLLFQFYLAAYKMMGGFYQGMKIKDQYPLHQMQNRIMLFFQDFIAPFALFLKSDFELEQVSMEDHLTHSVIHLRTATTARIGKNVIKKMEYEWVISHQGIGAFIIKKDSTYRQFEIRQN